MDWNTWLPDGVVLQRWLLALALFAVTLGTLHLLKRHATRRVARLAETTTTTLDDLLANLLAGTRLFFTLALALYLASQVLILNPGLHLWIRNITVVLALFQVASWGNRVVGYVVEKYLTLEQGAAASGAALVFLGRLLLWSFLLLLGLDNLGFDITTLVTGLGIGGIAVALAAQSILGDLFASLSIMLDRPFVAGDFIVVDEDRGTVENIGLKTTRVRSLTGEQLVFSNADLLKSRIRNFKRMDERRMVLAFGVVYQTPAAQLEKIPAMAREIVEAQEQARFDRAHFKGFGDSSLLFEVVYWIREPDYLVAMEVQQAINLALVRKLEEEQIEFAYPTRTLYLSGGETPGGRNQTQKG